MPSDTVPSLGTNTVVNTPWFCSFRLALYLLTLFIYFLTYLLTKYCFLSWLIYPQGTYPEIRQGAKSIPLFRRPLPSRFIFYLHFPFFPTPFSPFPSPQRSGGEADTHNFLGEFSVRFGIFWCILVTNLWLSSPFCTSVNIFVSVEGSWWQALQTDAEALSTAADDLSDQSEKLQKLTLVAKANSMRRAARDKTEQLKELNQLIDNKVLELENCP